MKTSKIAVGVDFSPESDLAVEQAVALARMSNAELFLVHAATPRDFAMLGEASPASAAAIENLQSQLGQLSTLDRDRLASMRKRLGERGVVVKQAYIESYPDNGLCDTAVEVEADLIVVGTHGRTGLRWFLLGSVAAKVIRMAETDVLVVRNPEVSADGFHRIAVATDFSESSDLALKRAMSLAAPGAEIDVIHFYSHVPHAALYDAVRTTIGADLDETILADLRAAGQSFIAQKNDSNATVRFYATQGHPVPGIVHWLERGTYDLVALGSHGRRGPRRFILGSVAEAVARRAPCSALVSRSWHDELSSL